MLRYLNRRAETKKITSGKADFLPGETEAAMCPGHYRQEAAEMGNSSF
jgi:hypothetical protein